MKNSIRAFFAILKGLDLCLRKPSVRRLAVVPWILGAFCYIASVIGAYHAHPLLLEWAVGDPEGFWRHILYWFAYLSFAVLLLLVTLILTMTLVMLCTSVFQTAIVQRVLEELREPFPEEQAGMRGLVKETGRTIVVEAAKLLWLLPLMLIVLIIGFIPLLTPFALLLGAWLLAYQFIDIVLDVYRVPARARFRFARQHSFLLVSFGLSLSICWAVPFLGILLPPAAVAGASWLLAQSSLLPTAELKKKES